MVVGQEGPDRESVAVEEGFVEFAEEGLGVGDWREFAVAVLELAVGGSYHADELEVVEMDGQFGSES